MFKCSQYLHRIILFIAFDMKENSEWMSNVCAVQDFGINISFIFKLRDEWEKQMRKISSLIKNQFFQHVKHCILYIHIHSRTCCYLLTMKISLETEKCNINLHLNLRENEWVREREREFWEMLKHTIHFHSNDV
jgi:hypothetical protein